MHDQALLTSQMFYCAGDRQPMALSMLGLKAEQRRSLGARNVERSLYRLWLGGDERVHSGKEGRVIVGVANVVTQRLGHAKLHEMRVSDAYSGQVCRQPLLAEVRLRLNGS